jgi:Domain of unknown function (DUF4434)
MNMRIMAVLWVIGGLLCGSVCAEEQTPPLIRGALWWITDAYKDWSSDQFEQAIQAQRDVGFDILWIFNTPALLDKALKSEAAGESDDILATVYAIADAKGMRVIADLPKGGWYDKVESDDMVATVTEHIRRYHARYGHHKSFHGWYLNYEINPIAPDDTIESAFWRSVWKPMVSECHRVAPESVVTISPFFLLDDTSRRGFIYLTPEQYASWWGKTMQETGIDILMLQDSGEHLSFFTLEQREPFFAALAKACHDAGAEFWVNVETGEAHVADWDEYIALYWEKKVPWRFTPIDWLEKKLRLAARHGDSIINWGYFPFMDPFPPGEPRDGAQEAYDAYKAYYENVKSSP